MKLSAQVMNFKQLWHWLKARDTAEEYLAEAANHADLERRLRLLERESLGPAFVTFNH